MRSSMSSCSSPCTTCTRQRPLPRNQALEAEIERLGVAPKQVERARWTFQESAEHAGFFEHGRRRLTLPSVARDPRADGERARDERTTNGGSASGPFTPPLQALLVTLLCDGQEWAPEQTHAYVNAARQLYTA